MTTQLEQQIISKLLKRGHHTEGEYSALEKRVKQLSELLEISHSRNAILEAQIQQDEETGQ